MKNYLSGFAKSLFERIHAALFGYMARSGLVLGANTLLTISDITQEALMVLENECVFADGVTKDYDDRFAVDGAKIGATINVRRPARFIGTTGPNLNIEDFNETYVPVTLTTQFHVDAQFNTQDLTLSLDDFSRRVLKPAIATIANKVDYDGLTMAKNNTANFVGTPGTLPNALLTFLTAQAYLDAEAAPRDGDRKVFIEPFTNVTMADSLKAIFNPQAKISEQYRKGLMGKDTGGMDWMLDQNVVNHSFAYGTSAVTLAMNQSNAGLASGWASTSTITISNTGSCQLNPGDVIQIAGVYAVNPQNRQSYGKLRNFVVTTAMAAGGTSVTVSPAIIYGGQFQNVTNTPGSTAAITVQGVASSAATRVTGPQNILCHRNAFTLATADLVVPNGVDFAGRASDKSTGLSIRVVKQYTINNDSIPTRLDVLYGWAPLYPELACRITG